MDYHYHRNYRHDHCLYGDVPDSVGKESCLVAPRLSQGYSEEYFKTHERVPSEFFSNTVLIKKGCALLLALLLMLGLMKLAGVYDFWSALALSYGIWLFIDWYDCFFLDWVLFAKMKSVRLPGTEHMDAAYHQKRYHFVQSLWGMLIGLIPCLIGAGLYTWIIKAGII